MTKKLLIFCLAISLFDHAKAQDYHKIKGILLYSNGLPAAGHELTADEINAETVTQENGSWEINVPYSYEPSKSITVRLNENTAYSFHKDRDSLWVNITPEKKGTLIKLVLHDRPVLLMKKDVPVVYDDTYSSKYTVFLFTLSERLNDKELWKIRKQLNTNLAIEIHSHYDVNLNHQLRYTIGRFDKVKDAENFLESIKRLDIKDFRANPPFIVNLLLAKPAYSFYRVQVRSSKKQMGKNEKIKIENKINRSIIEIQDLNVKNKKFDYFIDIKLENESEARKICSNICKHGLKDAYVVRFQVLENKIVRTKPLNKPPKLPKKKTGKA